MSSISQNTGTAPAVTTALTVAMNVNAGTITSSPQPTPSAASATRSAAVPLDTAMALRDVEPFLQAPTSNAWTRLLVDRRVVTEQRAAAQHLVDRRDLFFAERTDALGSDRAHDAFLNIGRRSTPPLLLGPMTFQYSGKSGKS